MSSLKNCSCMPARVSLGLLTILGVMMLYMARINLSVAIVAMVHTPIVSTDTPGEVVVSQPYCLRDLKDTEQSASGDKSALNSSLLLPSNKSSNNNINITNAYEDQMILSGAQKGMVLGAFFYGYFATNIPGGRLAEIYGTKRVFGGSILIGAILTFFTPLAAKAHYGVLILLRILIGLAHGVVYPSMNVMVARWIPPLERPRFMSFTYMANCLGTIVTLPLCGFIIAYVGWPSVFYVTGTLSLVWVLLWAFLMFDTPQEHPRISEKEREYIMGAIKKGTTAKRPRRTPWKSIMTSIPLWAINVAHIGSMFGFNLLLTQLPTYMSSILGFSIANNGMLSSVPFLTQWVGSSLCGACGDWAITRNYISINTARRIFVTFTLVVPGVVLVTVGYAGCNTTLAITLFSIATAFCGAFCAGHLANHLDLAPNFAGTILGVSNTLAYMVSMAVPVMVGAMTPTESLQEWQTVFWGTAGIYTTSWIFYMAFASTEIQPWNFDMEEEGAKEEEKEGLEKGKEGMEEEMKFLPKQTKIDIVKNGEPGRT